MLLRHQWRREAPGLLGWSLALSATMVPTVLLVQLLLTGNTAEELTRLLQQLPPTLLSFLGQSTKMMTLNAWMISLVFRTLAPLLLTVYTALGSLSILTRDMDTRNMDFLLALPVRRYQVLLNRFAVLASNLAVLHAVLLASVGVGVMLLGHRPDWSIYAVMALNGFLVQLALASLLLAVTVLVDDYTRGLFVTIGAGLALYSLPVAIEPVSRLGPLRKLSVFAYAQPAEVMKTGAIPPADAAVLVAATLALTMCSVLLFERKQLSA